MKFSMFLPVVVCEVDQSTRISCHTGVLPHIVVMTCPLICIHSLLMLCPWERVLCLYPSNTAGNVFYHLKHLLFSTFLCYCLFSFFSALQIKSRMVCEFGAHMREMQQNLELCHRLFQGPLCTPHYYAIFAAYK